MGRHFLLQGIFLTQGSNPPLLRVCCACSLSCVSLFVTPCTIAHEAPQSMEFSRQEYWSGSPFPPPGDLPNAGIEPTSSVSPALAGGFFTTEPPGKPTLMSICCKSDTEMHNHHLLSKRLHGIVRKVLYLSNVNFLFCV